MNLRSLNLNLVPVLWALLHERNVSRAAAAVGLSQPATSKALAQLRRLLDDPLLVRSGREMILTRRGATLLEPVAALCRDLDALWRRDAFDPAKSNREFVVAGTDYCALLLSPRMEPILASRAPGMSLRFVDLLPETALNDVRPVDFAIAPTAAMPPELKASGGLTPLFVDELVTIVASNHQLADKADLSIEDLAGERRIIFGYQNPFSSRPPTQSDIRDPMAGPASLVVPQFVTLLLLCVLTHATATVPRRIAEMLRDVLPLRIVEGQEPGYKVEMSLAWPPRFNGDVEHRWFRELAIEKLAGSPCSTGSLKD